MTLTKADLVQKVYKSHDNLTKAQATLAVEALLSTMKNCLASGEELLISGFGKFNVKDKNARRGRNPQTGQELILDPRRVITFKPSGILRSKING
jgi:integration host factor subunit alpha